MPFKSDERIYETSVTVGAGTYTLDGAVGNYQAVDVIGANNYGPFWAEDSAGNGWEVLIGQYVAGPRRLVTGSGSGISPGGRYRGPAR